MKDSGIKWIGEIPEDWGLGRIGQFYAERNVKVSDKDYPPLSITKNGVVPQLSSAAKTNDTDNRKLVKTDDFVINSRSDRRGSCGISPYDGSCSLINIVLEPQQNMCGRYYNYVFKSDLFADEFYKWGNGIVDDLWSTKWSQMKKIYVPYPPIPQQNAIATYLDSKCSQIDFIVEKTRQEIEKLKEYRQSMITEAVTKGLDPDVEMKDSGVEWIGETPKSWPVFSLKFLATFSSGKNLTSEDIEPRGKYPVFGGNGLRGYYSEFNLTGINILVGRQGALAGNVHLVDEHIWATDHALIASFHMDADKPYVQYLLLAMDLNRYASNTAAQPGLAASFIQGLKIPFPNLEEQKQISTYLDSKCSQIDAAIDIKQKIIHKLQQYRKSIIYEYVTGKKEVPSNA